MEQIPIYRAVFVSLDITLSVMSSSSIRLPTSEARQSLALRLQLPYSDSMQDWEWEVADASRFADLLSLYRTGDLSDDERFSLMEILVQCAEDLEVNSPSSPTWSQIEPLLLQRLGLHLSTVIYWARLAEFGPETQFLVSPYMRALLESKGNKQHELC